MIECQRCGGETTLFAQTAYPLTGHLVLCFKCKNEPKGPYDKRTRGGHVRASDKQQKEWNV